MQLYLFLLIAIEWWRVKKSPEKIKPGKSQNPRKSPENHKIHEKIQKKKSANPENKIKINKNSKMYAKCKKSQSQGKNPKKCNKPKNPFPQWKR